MSLLSLASKEINEKSERAFSVVIRLIGPGFILVMWGLVGYFTFFYFYVMAGVMNVTFPIWFAFPYHGLIGFTFFNVLFNHFMAGIIKPGNLSNLKSDIQIQKNIGVYGKDNSNEKLIQEHFGDENPSLEMKHLIRLRFKPLPDIKDNCPYFGIHCKNLKLILAHHGSICGDGILMRDHHCPWINNGIGMHNARYFLLFLFYVLGGCLEAIIPAFVTLRTPPFGDQHYGILASTLTMSGVLGGVMIGFNLYSLAKIANIGNLGDPTLQFWKAKAEKLGIDLYDKNNPEHMQFQGMRDNMFKTFGTRNFLRCLLPSIRDLPFFGHEWTLEVMELDAEIAAADFQATQQVPESGEFHDEQEMDDYFL